MADIRDFATLILDAYTTQDGKLFSELITTDVSAPSVNTLTQALFHTNEKQVKQIMESTLEDTSYALAESMINYMELVRYLTSTDIDFVFEKFAMFYKSFTPVFNRADTFFMMPVIKTLSTLLVQLAFRVDKMGLVGKACKANTAARLVAKVFNIMLADRTPIETSKQQGILHITNLVFKVYFKLNTVKMCQTFISNIKQSDLDLGLFPIGQQVTYRYYNGRYALYQGRLQHAQNHLMFAFEKCHAQQWHNKRLILHYLIPIRIILGHLPTIQLLEKYQLTAPYIDLMKALRSGNIHGYLMHLETHFQYFYSHFTYLLLRERGLVLLWRCLLYKLFMYKKSEQPNASQTLSFEECIKAFVFSSQDESFDFDDIESIMVSLGYIRGYIQHQRQYIVLSKTKPFPPISSLRALTERYNEASIEEHLEQTQQTVPDEIMQLMT
ncbi:hypothetical protein [Parasitella parasitica]|uniref:PCI domain-containing protein n=1 Tax=Parasitella parasitica TaxID=35722 RepID=A0A0B7N599_9FUNG|nr:hypothetical protein [Parasitella parasitica]